MGAKLDKVLQSLVKEVDMEYLYNEKIPHYGNIHMARGNTTFMIFMNIFPNQGSK
jgi:hypothetical protein